MIARFVVGTAAMLLIAGCGEKPQTLTSGKKPDTPSWQGTQGAYTDPGWKAGDRKAWEEHLKVRTQRGQNEYARGSGQI
jgi:hypothetical protein